MTEEEKKRKGLKPNMSFGTEVSDTNGFDNATLREQPAAEAEVQTEESVQPTHDYYADIMNAYEERKRADEESDKRDRIRTAIAGIGDTVGALGNLYFTTKYASPIPQTEGMSDKARERYEAAKARRDRNRAEWMNYALNVAGRKQAAEQADAARKDRKEYYDSMLANAQQKAEDKKKADAEKADMAATAVYISENKPLWEAWYRDGNEQDIAALEQEWEDAKNAGTLSENAYNARVSALHKQGNIITNANSKTAQQAVRKAASGSGSGSKGNNYTYISFGGGRGVNINKNDEKEVAAAYRWVPSGYGGGRRNLTDSQMASVVRAFLKSEYIGDARGNIEAHLQQVSRRSTNGQPTQSGRKTGYSREATGNGKKKGYTK